MKGGTGKSMVSALLCQHLHEKGVPVAGLDADIQQTFYDHRQRDIDENPGIEHAWDVEVLDISDPDAVKAVLTELKKIPSCIVIDCPGNISDVALQDLYANSDVTIVPFQYDYDSLRATGKFAKVFRVVSKAPMYFVPNRIVATDDRRAEIQKARDDAYTELREYGYITPRIKQSVQLKCYNTLKPLDWQQRGLVTYAFEPIVEFIKSKTDGNK